MVDRVFCGIEPAPILYSDDNWTGRPTTNDQLCIESVLPQYTGPTKAWLHIGAGNHSLGKRFAGQVRYIDAITVVQQEMDLAPSLPNYHVWIQNKHDLQLRLAGPYDVIIDTTPSGHACCWKHFGDYLETICHLLARDGVLLTDRVGLGWARDMSYALTPDQFASMLALKGLGCSFLTNSVIEVSRR